MIQRRREQRREVHDAGRHLLPAGCGRHAVRERRPRCTGGPRRGEDPDDGQPAVVGLVHEMELGLVPDAVHCVLGRGMEVHLLEGVLPAANRDALGREGAQLVVWPLSVISHSEAE